MQPFKFIMNFPYYQYPFSRWIFKRFFQIVAFITRRNLVGNDKTKLSPCELEVYEQLKEKGFYTVNPEIFSMQFQKDQEKAINSALRLIDNDLEQIEGSKRYLINLDLTKAATSDIQPMYEFFSRPEFVAIASAYLGERPLMVELKVLISPVLELPQADGSQLWHSDFDDLSDLKLFVFLEEVTDDSGPLNVIDKNLSMKLMKKWGYRWGKQGTSHSDDIVPAEFLSKSTSLIGKSKTIAFVDAVQCLHRGSQNPKRVRKILYATFNTRSSFRFPPFHWILGKRFKDSRASPLLALDPERKYLRDLAIND